MPFDIFFIIAVYTSNAVANGVDSIKLDVRKKTVLSAELESVCKITNASQSQREK